MKATGTEENRRLQILGAAGFFIGITAIAVGLIVGWRYVPGLLGEWLGVIAGIISTPFFLEATFVIVGFITVIALNAWRRKKEGDEFVYLEQVTGPGIPADLPDQARWAVYREKPLPVGEFSLLEQAEGAVEIGDFETAAHAIASMNHDELSAEGVLEVRLAMARASGKSELAARLEREIAERPT